MEGHCHLLIARFLPTLSFFPQYFPPDFLRYLFSTLCNLVVPRRLPYPVGREELRATRSHGERGGKFQKEREGGRESLPDIERGPFPRFPTFIGESLGKHMAVVGRRKTHTCGISEKTLWNRQEKYQHFN